MAALLYLIVKQTCLAISTPAWLFHLLPLGEAPEPAARLNPIFEVEGAHFVMVTQFAASVPMRELGEIVQSLYSEQDAVGAALDMLIIGF
jgi:toxin CcdB